MNMKEKKLPSKKKKKEPEVKLGMADINKNSNIEIDHTIRKIKEKELRLTLMWTCIFLLIFIGSAFAVGFSVVKLKGYSNVESGDLVITFNEKSDNLDNIITLDNNFEQTSSFSDYNKIPIKNTKMIEKELVRLAAEIKNAFAKLKLEAIKEDFE